MVGTFCEHLGSQIGIQIVKKFMSLGLCGNELYSLPTTNKLQDRLEVENSAEILYSDQV